MSIKLCSKILPALAFLGALLSACDKPHNTLEQHAIDSISALLAQAPTKLEPRETLAAQLGQKEKSALEYLWARHEQGFKFKYSVTKSRKPESGYKVVRVIVTEQGSGILEAPAFHYAFDLEYQQDDKGQWLLNRIVYPF